MTNFRFDSFSWNIPFLLNVGSRITQINVALLISALISTLKCAQRFQSVVDESRLLSLILIWNIRSDLKKALTRLSCFFLIIWAGIPQSIADGTLHIYLMIARAYNFTLSFMEMKMLDALILVIFFFDGRKVLNSYIVHGSTS